MARPEGFEPPTRCLEGSRSIHLSYGRMRGRCRPQRETLFAPRVACQGAEHASRRVNLPETCPTEPEGPNGAGDGTRTRNNQLGRLVLYQLNYARITAAPRRETL